MDKIKKGTSERFLSTEHHHCLLFCKKIRTGLQQNIDILRIKKYSDWFFTNYVDYQFSIEEKFLYTILGEKNEKIRRALSEHRRIRRLFNNTNQIEKSLSLLEEEFELHLRFEELVLYKELISAATAGQLEFFKENYSPIVFLENNGDMFWRMQ